MTSKKSKARRVRPSDAPYKAKYRGRKAREAALAQRILELRDSYLELANDRTAAEAMPDALAYGVKAARAEYVRRLSDECLREGAVGLLIAREGYVFGDLDTFVPTGREVVRMISDCVWVLTPEQRRDWGVKADSNEFLCDINDIAQWTADDVLAKARSVGISVLPPGHPDRDDVQLQESVS